MFSNISLILFDMDGVITDSIDLWFSAVTNVFIEYFNITPSREKFNKLLHKSTREVVEEFADFIKPTPELVDKLTNMVDECFETEMIPKLQPIKNVEIIVKELYKRKYRLGIITNGSEKTSKKMIRQLGLLNHFEHIFGTNGERPKPEPDLFFKALKQYKVLANECVYIGDSYSDLLASEKAGIHFIYFQNREIPEMASYEGVKIKTLLDVLSLIK